jgi:hypothetical protein
MLHIWQDVQGETRAPPATLWRYFRPKQLVEALRTRKLHFAAATQFLDDPYEGAMRVLPRGASAPTYSELAVKLNAYFNNQRPYVKISCWHEADFESTAMWQLYASVGIGIALRTSLARLELALKPPKLPLWYGRVNYIDMTTESVPTNPTPPAGPLKRYFYKHRAFEWERELRVVVDMSAPGLRKERMGILVDFDLLRLVEALMIGKELGEEDKDALHEVVATLGISDRLLYSSLLGTPLHL